MATRERFLQRILQRAELLPFGLNEAEVHADLRVALRRSGAPIGAADLIIAATALANGHAMMTHNVREFEHVPRLQVLPGPGTVEPNKEPQ
jgi:tRNA(fMet)-specific endonuclease VapC